MGYYRNVQLKLTPQRLAILKYLEANKEHPSAADIYRAVSQEYPTMSLSTVYNTLRVLKRTKNIKELSIDSDKKRFDPDIGSHHHLICVVCRKIVDVQCDFTLSVPENKRHGFVLINNHVDFYGICPDCRNHRKKGPG